MNQRRDYYRILHVDPDAHEEIIKASYRTLMQRMKMHPDLGGDHDAATLINEAFRVLGNPVRRTIYDRWLAATADEAHAEADATDDGGTKGGGAKGAPPPPASSGPSQTAGASASQSARTAAGPSTAQGPATARPSTQTTSTGNAAPQAAASTPVVVVPPLPKGPACEFCGTPHGLVTPRDIDRVCGSCGGSLCPVVNHQTDEHSRRAIERLPRHMRVTFLIADSGQGVGKGMTQDVSLNGMRMLTSSDTPVAARLLLECEFCSAIGVVRSARLHPTDRSQWEVGVQFLTMRLKRQRGGFISTVA